MSSSPARPAGSVPPSCPSSSAPAIEVVGLARSDASAAALTAAGAEVQRGTLDDLDILRGAAAASDGVIHLAFKHDIAFTGDFQGAADADRRAVEAFGEVLAVPTGRSSSPRGRSVSHRGGWRPNGTGTSRPGVGRATAAARDPEATAEFMLSLASRGVRSSVVRLPPTNHGEGDNGFMAALVGIAREKGVSGYIGDGANRWPAVHRLDSAHLFRLALENAPAGSTLHAVADEGVPIRDIAEVIGRHLDLPVVSVAPETPASTSLGWPASSGLTARPRAR